MRTLDIKPHKPFALSYQIPEGFDLVCSQCNRDTIRCQCQDITGQKYNPNEPTHTIKVKGIWKRYKTPDRFGASYYRRRYKTVTLTEETEIDSYQALLNYWAFVAQELKNGLITV